MNQLIGDAEVTYLPSSHLYRKTSVRIPGDPESNPKFEETVRDFQIAKYLRKYYPEHIIEVFDYYEGPCEELNDLPDLPKEYTECVRFYSQPIKGETLNQWLVNEKTEDRVAKLIEIFRFLCSISDFFTHYDFHGQNIMVTDSGFVLLDFGSSYLETEHGLVYGLNDQGLGISANPFWVHDAILILRTLLIQYLPTVHRRENIELLEHLIAKIKRKVLKKLPHADIDINLKRNLYSEMRRFTDWVYDDVRMSNDDLDVLAITLVSKELFGLTFTGSPSLKFGYWLNQALQFFQLTPEDVLLNFRAVLPSPRLMSLSCSEFVEYLKRLDF